MADTDNSIPIEAWNTVLFDKFVRFRDTLTRGLSAHSDEALRRHPYPDSVRVLDIGCGFGDTTQAIARQVGPKGAAVGVDCAENFITVAMRETAAMGIGNASFLTADVQTDDLRGPFDHGFARFGTMFFNMPGLALRNIARALKPSGRLTMIVWRKREDNAWAHLPEQKVKELVPVVSHEETDQVHCGPGPFSMAGADLVSDMLKSAGFERIVFERYDPVIRLGRDLDDAIDFAMALGPAGEIMRLAGEEGERRRPQVVSALRSSLAPYARPDGVWLGSSSWFVHANAPALH